MGVLDDWLKDEAAPPWGRIAATFVGGVQAVQNGKLLDQLTQWGSHFVRNASARWASAALRPTFCAHPGCQEQALAQCAACGGVHCLAHALVNFRGESICERCARELISARQRQQAEATKRDDVEARAADARRTLRISRDATWNEIHAQYRRLALKYNADRPMSAKKREANEERLKKINAAYALLRELHEREAA